MEEVAILCEHPTHGLEVVEERVEEDDNMCLSQIISAIGIYINEPIFR